MVMKKKILIFGKNGQVGSNLVKFFSNEENFEVTAYSSLDADFSNLDSLKNFLDNLTSKPDFIINAAAYTNVDKAEDEKQLADLINHQATRILADYSKKNNAKLIYYSTDYVFDGSGSEPFEADNTKNLHPLNYYGKTKLDGEKAIQNSGCDYLILRVSWVWDENPNHKNFVNTIKRLAKEREVLKIVSDQIGSPTSAEFIAKNTIQMIKKIINSEIKTNKIYHLNNGKFISWYDFAVQIIAELQKSGEKLIVKEVLPIKSSEYPTKAIRPLNSRLKNSFI